MSEDNEPSISPEEPERDLPIPEIPASNTSPIPWHRQRDFWLGFGLFWAIVVVTALLSTGLVWLFSRVDIDNFFWINAISAISNIVLALPLFLVLGMIIYFAKRRRWITFGLLAGFALSLAVACILGAVFMIACFSYSYQ